MGSGTALPLPRAASIDDTSNGPATGERLPTEVCQWLAKMLKSKMLVVMKFTIPDVVRCG